MVVDYSKWNNIAVSDSEYEESLSDSCSDYDDSHLKCTEGCRHIEKPEGKLGDSQSISIPIPVGRKIIAKATPKAKVQNYKKVEQSDDSFYEKMVVATTKTILPAHYKGSPAQRIHYMEAWKVHREYFEERPFLKFDPQIQIHHSDSAASIHPLLFTNPNNFVPKPNEHGEYRTWGLQEIYDDFFSLHMRRMTSQLLYNDSKSQKDGVEFEPAVQFINCLAYRKEIEILKYRHKFLANAPPQDYILEISLCDVTPKVWRRFSVSNKTKLSIFQDKILCPVFGWLRNYHGYYFTDARDGTQFGPTNCNAIDFVHLSLNGYMLMDDTKFYIRDILRSKGDVVYFTSDLGDHFEHVIRLVEIKSPDQSTGKVEILDGEMASPPEDSVANPEYRGNMGYQSFVDAWKKASSKKREKMAAAVHESLNYSNCESFDPFKFDKKLVQRELRRAFNSRGSVRSGCKMICFPVGNQKLPFGISTKRVGKTKEVLTPILRGRSVLKEFQSTVRDSKCNALCYNCGSPNELKSCGSCRMVWYCGEECQRQHWDVHQKTCRKRAKPKKDDSK